MGRNTFAVSTDGRSSSREVERASGDAFDDDGLGEWELNDAAKAAQAEEIAAAGRPGMI